MPEPEFAEGGHVDAPAGPVVYQDGCVVPLSSLSTTDNRALLRALNAGLTAMLDNNQE